MATLIIASISDRAGKSALAAALAVKMGSETTSISLGKASSPDAANDADAAMFASLLPEIPAIGGAADEIASNISELSKSTGGDVEIIEGSSDAQFNLQLGEATDGLILLVARYGEGISAAASEYGSRLAGVVINAMPRYRGEYVSGRLAADIETAGTKLLGTIPDDRRMLAPKLGQVAEFLGGQFLSGDDQSDRLIENFLIGGLVLLGTGWVLEKWRRSMLARLGEAA